MTYEELQLIVEAISQISTEIFFLFILYIAEDFVTSMTFYVILMIFAYKLFGLFSAHLTVKRMADELGYFFPYSDREKRHLYQIFERGLEREQGTMRGPGQISESVNGVPLTIDSNANQ